MKTLQDHAADLGWTLEQPADSKEMVLKIGAKKTGKGEAAVRQAIWEKLRYGKEPSDG